ncbi:MAG TPA: TolC family protein [Bacteroidota bacterium]
MLKPLLTVILFLSCCSAPERASARQATPSQLTLEKAVQFALRNNPDVRTSRLEMEKANGRVLEAWGNALPSVDVSSQYVHLIDKPVSYFPDYLIYPLYKIMDSTAHFPKATGQLILLPGSMSPAFTAGASLNVRQIIFNGAVFVGVGAAHIYSHLASDLFEAKKIETVAKVKKVYYGALMAREVVGLMESSLRNAEDNLKNVRLLRQQGIISEYDELRASVGVENIRPLVIQSENGYDLALDALRNTIGMTNHEDLNLVDSLTIQIVDDSVAAKAEDIVLEMNPGLSAVKRQIELNGAVVNAERSSYLPTIAAFGSYQYQAIKNEFNFSTNDFYKSSNIGVSLSLNLFQGLQTYARVEQAQLEEQKSEEQKTALERNLKTGVHSVRSNLQQAAKRLAAQEKTIEMAERGYKIVTARFLSSAATQLEVNDAELALTQAKVNRIQAVYDYLVASADLDQLMGRMPSYATASLHQ